MNERLWEDFTPITPQPKWCMTCANANGQPPWADSPLKSYCVAYPREEGWQKPSSVYYEGGECPFYRSEP